MTRFQFEAEVAVWQQHLSEIDSRLAAARVTLDVAKQCWERSQRYAESVRQRASEWGAAFVSDSCSLDDCAWQSLVRV